MKFIIEGIDRLGKSTLTAGLQSQLGYHTAIHFGKPLKLPYYERFGDQLRAYQMAVYTNMFQMLNSDASLIFDRGHLGECVYAPLYRGYEGDYVFRLEKTISKPNDVLLVLLTTDNLDFLEDDGKSFDFDRKGDEQDMFIRAFEQSSLKKCKINVHNGTGGYRSAQSILQEVIKNSVQNQKIEL